MVQYLLQELRSHNLCADQHLHWNSLLQTTKFLIKTTEWDKYRPDYLIGLFTTENETVRKKLLRPILED